MELCTYCGDLATTVDHVIPVSWSSGKKRKRRRLDLPGLKVPSCGDCNSRLTDRPIFTIVERKDFIAVELEKRWTRRRQVQWTEDDLAGLGPNLRRAVTLKIAEYQKLESRLEYAKLHSLSRSLILRERREPI